MYKARLCQSKVLTHLTIYKISSLHKSCTKNLMTEDSWVLSFHKLWKCQALFLMIIKLWCIHKLIIPFKIYIKKVNCQCHSHTIKQEVFDCVHSLRNTHACFFTFLCTTIKWCNQGKHICDAFLRIIWVCGASYNKCCLSRIIGAKYLTQTKVFTYTQKFVRYLSLLGISLCMIALLLMNESNDQLCWEFYVVDDAWKQ